MKETHYNRVRREVAAQGQRELQEQIERHYRAQQRREGLEQRREAIEAKRAEIADEIDRIQEKLAGLQSQYQWALQELKVKEIRGGSLPTGTIDALIEYNARRERPEARKAELQQALNEIDSFMQNFSDGRTVIWEG